MCDTCNYRFQCLKCISSNFQTKIQIFVTKIKSYRCCQKRVPLVANKSRLVVDLLVIYAGNSRQRGIIMNGSARALDLIPRGVHSHVCSSYFGKRYVVDISITIKICIWKFTC